MKRRLFLASALAMLAAGCGVKSDLEKPAQTGAAQPPKKNEKDPSKPPSQLGK